MTHTSTEQPEPLYVAACLRERSYPMIPLATLTEAARLLESLQAKVQELEALRAQAPDKHRAQFEYVWNSLGKYQSRADKEDARHWWNMALQQIPDPETELHVARKEIYALRIELETKCTIHEKWAREATRAKDALEDAEIDLRILKNEIEELKKELAKEASKARVPLSEDDVSLWIVRALNKASKQGKYESIRNGVPFGAELVPFFIEFASAYGITQEKQG